MVVEGMPPVSTMFTRAGKGKGGAMADACSGSPINCSFTNQSSPARIGSSPAKVIESWSKCYKQLHDLNYQVS